MRPCRRRIACTVETAGASTPSRARQLAILRAPQAGCSSRTTSTAASIAASLRPGARMRPPRLVRQFGVARLEAGEPLVGNCRTDSEPPAQLPPVHTFLKGKPHELTSLIHDRHLAPGHG